MRRVPRIDLLVHGVVALAWLSLVLGIALKIALLGNEAANAGKQRGADFKARSDMVFRQDRLRAVLEQETCEPALEPVIRKLELPLQKQLVTAGLGERR
jgi:hypothetical protein